jgi:hypothetical protein
MFDSTEVVRLVSANGTEKILTPHVLREQIMKTSDNNHPVLDGWIVSEVSNLLKNTCF